jgi:hypothetical protein
MRKQKNGFVYTVFNLKFDGTVKYTKSERYSIARTFNISINLTLSILLRLERIDQRLASSPVPGYLRRSIRAPQEQSPFLGPRKAVFSMLVDPPNVTGFMESRL